MSNVNSQNIVDDIIFTTRSCSTTAQYFSEAYKLISEDAHIVKIPNCPLESLLFRRHDKSIGILADFVTNFRTLTGRPLGHLDTAAGKVPIPQFWPTNVIIQQKYGLPWREGEKDLLVDAYLVSQDWNQKIITFITDLPAYQTSGF